MCVCGVSPITFRSGRSQLGFSTVHVRNTYSPCPSSDYSKLPRARRFTGLSLRQYARCVLDHLGIGLRSEGIRPFACNLL